MFWPLWALVNAVFYGIVSQLNRYWQLPGRVLVRWRGLVPALCALPLVFLFPPPTDPVYYLAALISSTLVPLHDSRMFNLTSRLGAAVVLRLRSLMLPLVFFAWLAIDPAYVRQLMAQPMLGGGILFCIACSSYFLFQLKHCIISRGAMREMIPIILMGTGFELCNKIAMDHGTFPGSVIYYVFLVSGLPLVYGLIGNRGNIKTFAGDMATMTRQGFILGSIWVAMMVCKNIAMTLTPNPAYVTAVALTSPFWASLLIRLRGEKEEADWVSGTGLVISIIALAVLSGFLHQ